MTAKEQVLKVYPDAWCDEFYRLETLFRIKTTKGYIGEWLYTEQSAWQSALDNINKTKSNDPTILIPDSADTQAKEA